MKRGQAALEFLSTYGFAFLVILVMIGALTYFGVLNPGRFLPQRCLVSAEFSCSSGDYRIVRDSDTQATMEFYLTNSLGKSVRFNNSDYNVSSTFITGGSQGTGCTFSPDGGNVASGAQQHVTCVLNGQWPTAGEKVRAGFVVYYQPLGAKFDQRLDGEIFAPIQ